MTVFELMSMLSEMPMYAEVVMNADFLTHDIENVELVGDRVELKE